MYSLLVLGKIPGTDIQITFGLWLSGVIILLLILNNRRLLPAAIKNPPKRLAQYCGRQVWRLVTLVSHAISSVFRQVLLCVFAAVYFVFFMPHHDKSDQVTP